MCRPGARVETGAKEQGSPDKDVPTAYVQDMLTTDPVHELGLRVTRLSSSTLEFVSLSEAKTELSAQLAMPVHTRCDLFAARKKSLYSKDLREREQPNLFIHCSSWRPKHAPWFGCAGKRACNQRWWMCRESSVCLAVVSAMCRVSEAQRCGCTLDGVQACSSKRNDPVWEELWAEAGHADAFG